MWSSNTCTAQQSPSRDSSQGSCLAVMWPPSQTRKALDTFPSPSTAGTAVLLQTHIIPRLWVPVPLQTPLWVHLPSQDAAAWVTNNNLRCSLLQAQLLHTHLSWQAEPVLAEKAGTAAVTVEEAVLLLVPCWISQGKFLPAVPVCALRCIGQVSVESLQAHAMFRITKQNEKWCCLLLPSGKLPLANGFIIFIISCLICFTILTGTIAKT